MLAADTHRAALVERHVRHSRGVGSRLSPPASVSGLRAVMYAVSFTSPEDRRHRKSKHLEADFRQRCHGNVVTSHKAQGWTADHVVVAAERFTSKGAYVACSRGRKSCIVHTPDTARLIERLPEGNRRARAGCAFRDSP